MAEVATRKVIGFVVNPVAGMRDRLVAGERAREALEFLGKELAMTSVRPEVTMVTSTGPMGFDVLRSVQDIMATCTVIMPHRAPEDPMATGRNDTMKICTAFKVLPVDIVLFCGGDGTAEDVLEAVGREIPVIGIPVVDGPGPDVFASGPEAAARAVFSNIVSDID